MRIGVDSNDILLVSDSVVPQLIRPPHDGPGICSRCHTWADNEMSPGEGSLTECENCTEVRNVLGLEPLRFAVVSMYSKPSKLREWLTRYKGREDEEDLYEPSYIPIVRSIVGRFIIEHGATLDALAGPFEGVVVVPSTTRPPPHPLEAVLVSLDLDVPVLELLERGSGDLGFRRPARDGYQVTGDRSPTRVLLVDDVYTTGSRLNSAAAALTDAGHEVGAALVLARRVNPEYNDAAAELWRAATASSFDWGSSPCLPT